MKIAVDACNLANRPQTGVENYTLNLLKALARVDRENIYTVYGLRGAAEALAIGHDNFSIREIPDSIKTASVWPSWALWNYALASFALRNNRPDAYLSAIPALPFHCPVPGVFIAYDLTPLIMPDAFFRRSAVTFNFSIRHAVKYASRIVAISASTKNDLVRYLKVEPSRVTVVYPGYNDGLFAPASAWEVTEKLRAKFGISGPYILFAGTLEPRKNVVRLISAFAKLKKDSGIKHKLVIAGARGWLYSDIDEAAAASGFKDDIVFTGYVAKEDLPYLYGGADILVYPSLYEGFGLPPLEAMACGTPVITSDTSSLPEVVGDAGIMVDPLSTDGMAEAMLRVVSDPALRKDMRRRGLERAKLFSWEKAAREMLQVISAARER